MKYYIIVKGAGSQVQFTAGSQVQFTVEPCTAKMSARDVRDCLRVIVEDMATMLVRDGIQPILEVSEASRKRGYGNAKKIGAGNGA